ncbi:MAG TPA: citrate transporter [Burkholderiales bacterium]|nr:citrate transporter [Burkholderiales bacterium]
MPSAPSVPIEFVLFALTLIGIALFYRRTLEVALAGLAAVVVYKLLVTGFREGTGVSGLATHLGHEWVVLANLLGLLTGFALLANHFYESRLPQSLPEILPDDWKGGFALLLIVFVVSSFLDNIAAAIIGGTMARAVFRGKVHVGYVAAVVAAANAGGAGSVVGDTTTTMMWIDGVHPLAVLDAYVAAGVAVLVTGLIAAFQQQRHSPILKHAPPGTVIDWPRVWVVAFVLGAAIAANVTVNALLPEQADRLPFVGLAVWGALLLSSRLRRPDYRLVPAAARSSVFLLALVLSASLMPVERLPTPTGVSTLGLGFVSAVFDNIPLTALALEQGGYDWGMLAYSVGFGGSMLWFGSSAGVAMSGLYPEARSAVLWLRAGWHVVVAYLVGFAALMLVLGWHPTPKRAPVLGSLPSCAAQDASKACGSIPVHGTLPPSWHWQGGIANGFWA